MDQDQIIFGGAPFEAVEIYRTSVKKRKTRPCLDRIVNRKF